MAGPSVAARSSEPFEDQPLPEHVRLAWALCWITYLMEVGNPGQGPNGRRCGDDDLSTLVPSAHAQSSEVDGNVADSSRQPVVSREQLAGQGLGGSDVERIPRGDVLTQGRRDRRRR